MRSRVQRPFFTEQETANGQPWLTTFNDMITLLMVFFVLLFTMSSMDIKRFKTFQNALQSAMGVLHEGRHAPVGTISDQSSSIEQQPENTAGSSHATNQGLDVLARTRGLEAEYTARGIQLTLDDKLLFGSGKAGLTTEGKALLVRVATIIRPFNRYIRVEGHTDNVPISTERYPSNWELSTARAIAVVKYLIEPGGIVPDRLSAAGYGDSKPRVPNDTTDNQSKNRRVEIILGPVARQFDT
jgi:chemotaxis protein MotB